MLHVGIAGIGFMGYIHWLAYQRVPGVKVTAVCSRDQKKLAGDWRGIRGNFGPSGKQVDLTGVARYQRLDDLLADAKIDVVDVCLPPALHAATSIAASAAGKHVLCEKPIALATTDAARMVKAAATHQRQLLIGHVLPFVPEYAYLLQAARQQKYGKLLGGHFKRVIADPLWLPDFYDADKVGGPLVDLHIHDAHLIRLLFGMPRSVSSHGRMRGDVVTYCETQFTCDDADQVVSAASGVIDQQGRSFTHAFEVHFERATLLYDFAVIDGQPHAATPLTVLDNRKRVVRPGEKNRRQKAEGRSSENKVGAAADEIAGFVAELTEMARSIKSGEPSEILGGTLAADALLLCQRQSQAVKTGRLVRV